MKILYHHRTQALDGQRVHIREIQDALRAAGHEVLEVAPVAAAEKAGGPTLPTWRRRFFGMLARWAPKGAYEFLELGYNLIGYVELARAIHRFRPDFLYERYALNTVAGVWASRRFGIPLLLEVNSPLAEEKHRLGQLAFHQLARRLECYVLRRATRVLAVTGVLQRMLAEGANLDARQILVVQNGVRPEAHQCSPSEREARRKALGLDGHVVIGAVGFFRPWHGIDLLLQCLHRNTSLRQRARLLLIGEGPAIPELKRMASEWNIEQDVIFTGAIPHDQVPPYVSAMDITLIPRAVAYASPLKLFEYMAAGKAILAPRQENLTEVLTEDGDALCFTPEDLDEMEEKLQRLVEDEALRGHLGMEARQTIDRLGLTWDGNAVRIVEVFEQLGGSANQTTAGVLVNAEP